MSNIANSIPNNVVAFLNASTILPKIIDSLDAAHARSIAYNLEVKKLEAEILAGVDELEGMVE